MQKFPPQNLLRRIDLSSVPPRGIRHSLKKQWLVTNGLGGYSSGTIAGAVTWRYHGLLVSALPVPLGRTVMLNQLEEHLRLPGTSRLIQFSGSEPPDNDGSAASVLLREFRLENQLPVWRYEIDGAIIEKRVLMPYFQNTVHITYTLLSGGAGYELVLRPLMNFRPIESAAGTFPADGYILRSEGKHLEIDAKGPYPTLRFFVDVFDSTFTCDGERREVYYARDAERGYDARGTLWCPGYFSLPLRRDAPATLVASTEEWRTTLALNAEEAHATERARLNRLLTIAEPAALSGPAAELVLAADQFVMTPTTRELDAARARATGDQLCSVIAGYHWFTDWGRDTMISLEGLTLVTGRFVEAGWILRTFARYVHDGLVPNMFPEGQHKGLYHTADASLWFFHAVDRYLQKTGDREILATLLPVLETIVDHHLRGTRFGIGVDPEDGLLREGQDGYQLTWMDAKVGDWVVTPRRGKAVEINALWYNALRLFEDWLNEAERVEPANLIGRHAQRTRAAFNRRFWNGELGCLFDVVDGEQAQDPSIRPNQILAISLAHPVLDEERWASVLSVVEKELLTPVGLRSLSPTHPDYKPKYSGDLRSRDAAYHQGTVWAWLIGPFIDAWLKIHAGDPGAARKFLDGFVSHLNEGCIGSISEIFDAEIPFTERGCIAQAWSVAEVLRCYVKTTAISAGQQ